MNVQSGALQVTDMDNVGFRSSRGGESNNIISVNKLKSTFLQYPFTKQFRSIFSPSPAGSLSVALMLCYPMRLSILSKDNCVCLLISVIHEIKP